MEVLCMFSAVAHFKRIIQFHRLILQAESSVSSAIKMKFLAATAVSWAAVLIIVVSGQEHHAKILDPVMYRHHKALDLQNNKAGDAAAAAKGSFEGTQKEETGEEDVHPTVTIPVLGTAKGSVLKTLFGRDFTAFRGIPYAHKPTRYQYSEIWDNVQWGSYKDVYDATYFRDRCPQHSLIGPVISGSDDCLHISVYSPLTNFTELPADPLPVMVFIHGGAYLTGEATIYMPSKLLDRDVVVAVIQYRLGTLGFLYSGTKEAPGNQGLMDQVNALRWVQRYISFFGGNPDLVTVFGQSAGGASTSWMQLSPQTRADHPKNNGKPLAHRFIPMSGSALEYWTLEHTPTDSFYFQTEAAGCGGSSALVSDIMYCMSSKLTIDEVVWGSMKAYSDDRARGGLGFVGQVPVIQDSSLADQGIELVITEQPTESIKNGRFLQVPTMTGAVRDEGSLVVGLLYDDYLYPNGFADNATYLRDDLMPFISKAFGIEDTTNAVANSFVKAFLPDDVQMGNWDSMVGGLVDLGGMLFLKSGMWTMAHEITKYNSSIPVYFYSFEFESDDSLFDWIFMSSPDMPIHGGIAHTDDLLYLFNLPAMLDTREREMARRLTTLYTNFALYGRPTPPEVVGTTEGQWPEFSPEWTPFSSDDPVFMLIQDEFTVQRDFTKRWNYNMYGYSDLEDAPAPPPRTPANAAVVVEAVDHVAAQLAEQTVLRSDYDNAVSEASSYKNATLAMGGVAACAVLALVAALVVMKRRTSTQRRSLASADNLALGNIN